MNKPPRPRGEGVITRRMWVGILFVGLVMAAGTLLVLDASLPGGLIEGTGTMLRPDDDLYDSHDVPAFQCLERPFGRGKRLSRPFSEPLALGGHRPCRFFCTWPLSTCPSSRKRFYYRARRRRSASLRGGRKFCPWLRELSKIITRAMGGDRGGPRGHVQAPRERPDNARTTTADDGRGKATHQVLSREPLTCGITSDLKLD